MSAVLSEDPSASVTAPCLRWPRESHVRCVPQSPAPGLASIAGSLSSLAGAVSARLPLHGPGLGSRAGCPMEERVLQTSCSSCLRQPATGSGSFLLPMESGPGPVLPSFLPSGSAVLWGARVGYRHCPCVRLHFPFTAAVEWTDGLDRDVQCQGGRRYWADGAQCHQDSWDLTTAWHAQHTTRSGLMCSAEETLGNLVWPASVCASGCNHRS